MYVKFMYKPNEAENRKRTLTNELDTMNLKSFVIRNVNVH